jgi:hypothetical protein
MKYTLPPIKKLVIKSGNQGCERLIDQFERSIGRR